MSESYDERSGMASLRGILPVSQAKKTLDETIINKVDNLVVNDRLTWCDHIQAIISKAAKRIRILRR